MVSGLLFLKKSYCVTICCAHGVPVPVTVTITAA